MKTRMFLTIMVLLVPGLRMCRAYTLWDTGYHEIVDGDVYLEIFMRNDARATMFGGDVFKVETRHTSSFEMRGGEMDLLYLHDDSAISLYGGSLTDLAATDDSSVSIYAYDVVHHATGGGYDDGWLEGKYIGDDSYFSFTLVFANTISHHYCPVVEI